MAPVAASLRYSSGVLSRIAPGFLLAAPALSDPNFARSVVLMCAHEEEGSLGVVINRPLELELKEALSQLEITAPRLGPQKVLLGGPVMPERAFVLYEPLQGAVDDDDLQVGTSLFLSSSLEVLGEIVGGRVAKRFHFLLGHAGWGAGQLHGEIQAGAWIPAELDPDTLFSVPFDDRWEHLLRRQGIDPGLLGGGGSSAQA